MKRPLTGDALERRRQNLLLHRKNIGVGRPSNRERRGESLNEEEMTALLNRPFDVEELYVSGQEHIDTTGPLMSVSEMEESFNKFERHSCRMLSEQRLSLGSSMTPFERYIDFVRKTPRHSHDARSAPIDTEKALVAFSSHPDRLTNPRAVLSTEASVPLDSVQARRALERFLEPRLERKRTQPGSEESLRVDSLSAFVSTLLDRTSLSLYGCLVNSSCLAPRKNLTVFLRLDGVERYYAALVFVFSSSSSVSSSSTEGVTLQTEFIPVLPGEGTSTPATLLYYFYCQCECRL